MAGRLFCFTQLEAALSTEGDLGSAATIEARPESRAMGPHHSRKVLPPSPLRSTRIEPNAANATSFPATAVGVEVITIGEERPGERIWVGGSARGVEVTRHLRFFSLDAPALRSSLFTALRALDGSRSIGELSSSLELPIPEFSRLLFYLEGEGLIHFHSERITKKYDSATNQQRKNTLGRRDVSGELTRREIERAHLPRGTSFLKRSEQSIIIVSDQATSISPIATTLASLLFGAGLTRIRFFTPDSATRARFQSDEKITDRDLGISIFDGADIGASKVEKLAELAHRSAILPLEESRSVLTDDFDGSSVDLIISVGFPRPDHHQRWLSEDNTFLLVPGYLQGELRIGPLVIPGKTPCLRCYELNQMENDFWREQSRQLQLLHPTIDPPKIASHLIASLAAHFALRWLDADDEGKAAHPLLGAHQTLLLDRSPTRNEEGDAPLRTIRWQNHPECGCLWMPAGRTTSPS